MSSRLYRYSCEKNIFMLMERNGWNVLNVSRDIKPVDLICATHMLFTKKNYFNSCQKRVYWKIG